MAAERAIQKDSPQAVEVGGSASRRAGWTYRPNVDIFDTAEAVLLVADLPGADPESIDVSLESGILTVQADAAPRPAPGQSLIHEYGVGSFHRRFEIDETIESEAVSADYREGALTVRLPKAQRARRRRIPVSA